MRKYLSRVLFVITVLLYIPFAIGHWDAAYFRSADDGFTTYNDWMKSLDDDFWLSELAIPGTHDSAAYQSKSIMSNYVETQCLSFKEQLQYGIRFFDIRIRHKSNEFELFHGVFYLFQQFGDFLKAVDAFLTENPSETVLFRLKEETDGENNSRNREKTLEYYLEKYNDKFMKTNTNVKLRDARGKFVIFSDNTDFHDFGIKYIDSEIQDYYMLSTNWDLYEKWNRVKDHLQKAAEGDNNTFYINYLSATGATVFPFFVASGHVRSDTSSPRLSTGLADLATPKLFPDFPRFVCFIGICTIFFEGTNILARDQIRSMNDPNNRCLHSDYNKRSVGIILADYPGTSLIKQIIDNNKIASLPICDQIDFQSE